MKTKQTINIERRLISILKKKRNQSKGITYEKANKMKLKYELGFLGNSMRVHAEAYVHRLAACVHVL